MHTFSEIDIARGSGVFERAMRTQSATKGFADRLSHEVAIGVIASAIKSGMPASLVDELPDALFAADSKVIKRALAMYEGDDWSNNLWHRLPIGKYKLCTALCQAAKPGWRYDTIQGASNF